MAADDLARLAAGSGRRILAWTALTEDERTSLTRAAERRDLPVLSSAIAGNAANVANAANSARTDNPTSAVRATRPGAVYTAASNAELRSLIDGLSVALRSLAAPLLAQPPQDLVTRRGRLSFGNRPLIMGVLNVTPDSFSDGGVFADPRRAIDHAWAMSEEGADLIDIGGESTRPGAERVSESAELLRVLPVLEGLGDRFPIPISIDSYKGTVVRRALEAGADIVNDITGLCADPTVASIAAEFEAPLVVSHIRGTPKTMQADLHYDDLMAEVASRLLESATLAIGAGVRSAAVILDPGIGFGKSFENNLELIRRLPELSGLGHALLAGVSRKSFIGKILGTPPLQRLEGSLAAATAAHAGGASILRVHDVAETIRFFKTLTVIHGWDAPAVAGT